MGTVNQSVDTEGKMVQLGARRLVLPDLARGDGDSTAENEGSHYLIPLRRVRGDRAILLPWLRVGLWCSLFQVSQPAFEAHVLSPWNTSP